MTFLEGVQELVRLAGITDSGGPSTVKGQQGDFRKAINYYRIAHEEIQNEFADWNFLWKPTSLTTSDGIQSYDGPSDLETWDLRTIQYDDQVLDYVPWEDYVADSLDKSKPEYVVVQPDNKLRIVPTPDDAYTIDFHYFRKPKTLVENGDVPLIPERYQQAIIGRALIMYGNFEAAGDAKVQGQEIYEQFMRAMMNNELPRHRQTHARAESESIVVVPE